MTDNLNFSIDRAQLNPERTLLTIPRATLVVLCGASGSGKSTFATRHFPPTWVLSSDKFRGLVSDDVRNQDSSKEAFDVLFHLLEARLKFGRTTVVDSTALTTGVRRRLLNLARKYDFEILLLLFNIPESLCVERDAARIDPAPVGPKVVAIQYRRFREVQRNAHKEGFNQIIELHQRDMNNIQVSVVPLSVEKPEERGPFDIIGDIHGCFAELAALLGKLGYRDDNGRYSHPEVRKVIFLGDLVNRGPQNVEVLKLVARMVQDGSALYVRGNHCQSVYSYLRRPGDSKNELPRSWLSKLSRAESEEINRLVRKLVGNAPPYLILNNGRLVVTHAGIEEKMIGRLNERIFRFCLYGDEKAGEDGKITRRDWAATYRGKPLVVFGHTPTTDLMPRFRNNTLNLDQGCVYGGRLSALRYPEMDFEQVSAAAVYFQRN
jgi:protein phosphatase